MKKNAFAWRVVCFGKSIRFNQARCRTHFRLAFSELFANIMSFRMMGVSATLFSLSHDDSLLIFLPHIREQYRLSHGSNGRPRMTIELKEVELDVGERRVGRLMGNHGIKPIRTRKHKVIKDRHLLLGVTANWLEGSFVAYAPCPKWAGDITDIWTSQGWPTLSVILDLDSWPVVGRTISDRMKTYLGIWALDMVARLRQPPGGRFFPFGPRQPILFL